MRCKLCVLIYFIFITFLFTIKPSLCISPQNIPTNTTNNEIIELLKSKLDTKVAQYYTDIRGVIISVDSNIFFEDGKSELKESSKQLLYKLAEIIEFINKNCIIEANTNYSNSETYPPNISHVEFTIIQAQTIAKYIAKCKNIKPIRLHSVGFGKLCPRENNNRIDFVIINKRPYTIDF